MKLLQQLYEVRYTHDKYENLWIVFYTYGHRGSGSYLVRALTRQAARDIIRFEELGYRSIRAVTLAQGAEEFGMDIEDLLDGVNLPDRNESTHLESGS